LDFDFFATTEPQFEQATHIISQQPPRRQA
jgi:hypothetical protein